MRKVRLHPSGDVIAFKDVKKGSVFRVIRTDPEDTKIDEAQLHMASTDAEKDEDGNWTIQSEEVVIKDH